MRSMALTADRTERDLARLDELIAQKEAESRYPDRSMPASRKVAGAFGKEPRGRSGRG